MTLSRILRPLAAFGAAGLLALGAAGCDAIGSTGGQPSGGGTVEVTTIEKKPQVDPATEYACTQFFGDPDYVSPEYFQAIAMGASALEIGGTNEYMFQTAAEDVRGTFAESTEDVKGAAGKVADWIETESEKGKDADTEAFKGALEGLASACAPMSVHATWASGGGEKGKKPAKLVCAELATKPQLFTEYRNGNVFTSNSFKAIGFRGKYVPKSDRAKVQNLNDILQDEIDNVDDEGVKKALAEVQKPFQKVLDGDPNSSGSRSTLDGFGAACEAAGYEGAVDLPSEDPGESGEGGGGELAGE